MLSFQYIGLKTFESKDSIVKESSSIGSETVTDLAIRIEIIWWLFE